MSPAAGASQKVTLTIDPRLLADWKDGGWVIAADYGFAIGRQCRDFGAGKGADGFTALEGLIARDRHVGEREPQQFLHRAARLGVIACGNRLENGDVFGQRVTR